ncbi:MAG: glycosyltransferase, partial [Candidatus Paceibacterota bacterium]
MKVLFANARDIIGGAAIAAYRLHKGMQENGYDSNMLVDIKASSDDSIIGPKSKFDELKQKLRSKIDYLPQRLQRSNDGLSRSLSFVPGPNLKKINKFDRDVVHLHWINNGFLSIEQLPKIKGPVVWTLHDMWPFCGAEHYTADNQYYKKGYASSDNLLDKWVWRRKNEVYSKIENLTIVTPSNWLAECARESLLLGSRRVEVIGNGIDTNFFKPKNIEELRSKYEIPLDKKIVLFSGYKGVEDPRKGFKHLIKALRFKEKNENINDIELVIIGSDRSDELDALNIKSHFMGMINDSNVMRDLYALSDLFVLPSKEDNLPNTVLEAMSCGTPVVAFNIGGVPDMVDHKENGYLAESFN